VPTERPFRPNARIIAERLLAEAAHRIRGIFQYAALRTGWYGQLVKLGRLLGIRDPQFVGPSRLRAAGDKRAFLHGMEEFKYAFLVASLEPIPKTI
jgi:hypothetical protein